MRGEQAIFNLEIKKKSGLSINPDIHHSKVFSSGRINFKILPPPHHGSDKDLSEGGGRFISEQKILI